MIASTKEGGIVSWKMTKLIKESANATKGLQGLKELHNLA